MGIHKEDLAKFLVTNFNTPARKLPNPYYFVPEIRPLIDYIHGKSMTVEITLYIAIIL